MQGRTTSTAIALAVAAAALGGCGDGPSGAATTTTVAIEPPATTAPEDGPAGAAPAPTHPAPGSAETPEDDPRVNARERRAARTVRAYVTALDAHDGAAVCALLAPAAPAQVPLPETRGGCAASLDASIGYRDPRGLPVWDGARPASVRVRELSADGRSATVIATVVTRFADRSEESIEDDVVYLTRLGGRWRVAKPSATLYRAVGIADVPPSVLAPPR